MLDTIRLLRPKQWAKNLLVFAAYLFAAKHGDSVATTQILIAFASMCLVSSGTYVFNDLADANRDRNHPTKRHRPIAAGRVKAGVAAGLGLALLVSGGWLAATLGLGPLLIVGAYLLIQLAYNLGLKRVAVADVFAIAGGFVLRAALGAAAIDVVLSGWLLFCTGALALMLGFAKRRQEFISQADDGAMSRESLAAYSQQSLDAFVIMFATGSCLCYGLYCLESQTALRYPGLILTMPFVVYGISRYVLIVFTKNEGAEPADVLFRDIHVIVSVVGFIVAAILAMKGIQLPIVEPS